MNLDNVALQYLSEETKEKVQCCYSSEIALLSDSHLEQSSLQSWHLSQSIKDTAPRYNHNGKRLLFPLCRSVLEASSLLSRIAIFLSVSESVFVWGSLEHNFFLSKYFCLPRVTKNSSERNSATFFFSFSFPTDTFANTVIKRKLHSSIATEVIMGHV